MYKIDSSKFNQSLNQFMGCVLTEQDNDRYHHSTKISFHSGWLKDVEFYKYDIWSRSQEILQINDWNEKAIGTGLFTNRIIDCMNLPMEEGKKQKQNLLNQKYDVPNLTDRLLSDVKLSDGVLYRIFCTQNNRQSFEDAIDLWGEKLPFISYLFFLKDREHYLPVRPKIMPQRFESLGIQTNCLSGKRTWEKYDEYLQIIKDVQQRLSKHFDSKVELLDAHSFVWSMWLLDNQKNQPLAELRSQFNQIDEEIKSSNIQGSTRTAVIKARVNQSVFRKLLLERFPCKCRLCGIENDKLLIASHIKPWVDSTSTEKVDVNNGFLFCPNHDRLFNQGLISFDNSGKILISSLLSSNDLTFTNIHDHMHINLNDANRPYLRYHRNHIFKP